MGDRPAAGERFYAVLLHGKRVGMLVQRGDFTRFLFSEEYLADPRRAVLGLRFEENLGTAYSSALRLPRWFSNLLPEGPLRDWIAEQRGVKLAREMELLAEIGHDLPGAVQVLPTDGSDSRLKWPESLESREPGCGDGPASPVWRFSLAGVALKFSMLSRGDRLTVPVAGERGDWIVKFPDYRFQDVPRNEFAMMSLARAAGIDVPDVLLPHRDDLPGVPDRMWPSGEEWAYAVRRFDRHHENRDISIHIEDLAQVRDVYPEGKYQGSFETVASLVYRGRDLSALREFARRMAFIVLIGNGDAHLKNWSLIYPDQRIPTLSPAYDLVSTHFYHDDVESAEDLGLKFDRHRRFSKISIRSFERLETQLDERFGRSGADLPAIVAETVTRTLDAWPEHRDALSVNPALQRGIEEWMTARRPALLSRTTAT